jgi:hypothetical protein
VVPSVGVLCGLVSVLLTDEQSAPPAPRYEKFGCICPDPQASVVHGDPLRDEDQANDLPT